jgi:hypothetical protein
MDHVSICCVKNASEADSPTLRPRQARNSMAASPVAVRNIYSPRQALRLINLHYSITTSTALIEHLLGTLQDEIQHRVWHAGRSSVSLTVRGHANNGPGICRSCSLTQGYIQV